MKYRRDISSTLQLLAVLLILLVGYHAWLKPTYLTPGPSSQQPSESPPPQPTPDFTLPATQDYPSWDVPQSRLIDLGPAPTRALGLIRDEVEKGDYGEAERRLTALGRKGLEKAEIRRYVAALWNNLGVQQEKFGGTALSVKAFKKAVALDPASSLAHLSLTQAYWELRDPAMTPQFLEQVIRLAPEDPFPRLALAELLLEKGRANAATTHLTLAGPRAQKDPLLRPYLEKLLAKAEAASPTADQTVAAIHSPKSGARDMVAAPMSMQPDKSLQAMLPPASQPSPTVAPHEERPRPSAATRSAEHFLVRFDGPEDQASWTRMRAILEYAYQEIPSKLGQLPTNPIAVVLHTGRKFSGEAGTPHGADALFDHATGTIHLPVQGALDDLALFSRIARHQFVHALLHGQSRNGSASVPTWLVEGLAIHLAEDPWPDTEDGRPNVAPFKKLPSLQSQWTQLPPESLPGAYVAAGSATQLLIDSYGINKVRQVLTLLWAGQSFDAALQKTFSFSHEQFQRQWEQTQGSPRAVSAS